MVSFNLYQYYREKKNSNNVQIEFAFMQEYKSCNCLEWNKTIEIKNAPITYYGN